MEREPRPWGPLDYVIAAGIVILLLAIALAVYFANAVAVRI